MDFLLPINGPYLRVLLICVIFARFQVFLGQDCRLLYNYWLFSLASGLREGGSIDSAISQLLGLLVFPNYLILLASILPIESPVRTNTSVFA
jgi:hypothetical protein